MLAEHFRCDKMEALFCARAFCVYFHGLESTKRKRSLKDRFQVLFHYFSVA